MVGKSCWAVLSMSIDDCLMIIEDLKAGRAVGKGCSAAGQVGRLG